MTHLLVTNDFPPKIGGIQSYLYELWRRVDPERFVILTGRGDSPVAFDRAQRFRIERVRQNVLLPTRALRARIDSLAHEVDAEIVLLDPALPLGALGPSLEHRYGLVLHGAEVTVPARLPGSSRVLRRLIERAAVLVAAGNYPAGEARRLSAATPPIIVVPPGVDVERFIPLDDVARVAARKRFGVESSARLVVSVSRLVPRKGMDVLIEAAAKLHAGHDDLVVLIAGSGRDHPRLEKLIARLSAPVRLLGRVEDVELPSLVGAADVFAMFCRNRWLGLEQEGFGIVFLEAAACGVAPVAGRSGGADEAVLDNRTGLVLDRPGDLFVAQNALERLLDDAGLRSRLGWAARERVVTEFTYDALANQLAMGLARFGG